jgi:hypothetical protein
MKDGFLKSQIRPAIRLRDQLSIVFLQSYEFMALAYDFMPITVNADIHRRLAHKIPATFRPDVFWGKLAT